VSCFRPDRIEFAFRDQLLLPAIPSSPEDISHWRRRYALGIDRLRRRVGVLEDPAETLGAPGFYLAYHNQDDRPLMEAARRMFRSAAPSLTYEADYIPRWAAPREAERRCRVGFISEYLASHTIGKLYQGLLRDIDRRRFEVVLIHMPTTGQDDFRSYLDSLADRALTLPQGVDEQRRMVAELELDVLFFTDIGITSSTYFLAYARLAPVQVVAWGHPDTTGLDTIDYFLSSAAIEPLGADRHYTERLIRLTHLPCHYLPPPFPATVSPPSSWGLPETGTLYACPQSLFKLHPEFDAVLAEVADRDPQGHIVFLEGRDEVQTNRLRDRWARRHPILIDRVIFLPRQSFSRFMELVGCVDVLLDPIHFGSGNTMYEAMCHGTPIVTWPGCFMRGRIVAAAYAQMDIVDAPVVERIADYAAMAVSLGRDPAWRKDLRHRSRSAARERLFSDMSVVREFEAFLEAAIDARGKGARLPKAWQASVGADLDGSESASTLT
jgi:predicted O-linked N-acetylglucosamine transferase (SPINDLY family)